MLTAKFISKVKEMGYVIVDNANYFVIKADGYTVAKVSKYYTGNISTDYGERFDDELLELLTRYSLTPAEERTIQLADAERVILENLPEEYVDISRTNGGKLYIVAEPGQVYYVSIFDNLFQFIKNRESHSIKELLGC